MEGTELIMAEALCKRLGVTQQNTCQSDSPYGTVYLAWIRMDEEDRWDIIWAACGMMQKIEGGTGANIEDVKQATYDHAVWNLEMFKKNGLLPEGTLVVQQ